MTGKTERRKDGKTERRKDGKTERRKDGKTEARNLLLKMSIDAGLTCCLRPTVLPSFRPPVLPSSRPSVLPPPPSQSPPPRHGIGSRHSRAPARPARFHPLARGPRERARDESSTRPRLRRCPRCSSEGLPRYQTRRASSPRR